MTQPHDATSFLMGGSVPSAKFDSVGVTVGGRITETPAVQQQRDFTTQELKVWEDGSPQMQLVVTIATDLRDPADPDDDGSRRLYIKGQLKQAVAAAVRKAGAKSLEIGGVLTVTYTGDGVPSRKGINPPKQYAAEYSPAAAGVLHTPDPTPAGMSGDGFTPPTAPALPAGLAGLSPEALQALAQLQAKQSA